MLLLVLVLMGQYLPMTEAASRQVGILDFQASGLWDAAGRDFTLIEPSGGQIHRIKVEIGEFVDGQQAYFGIIPTRQKIEYDHIFAYVPVDPGDESALLPTFFPELGRPLAIPYSLFLYRTDSGALSAHLLTESSNRLMIVSVLGRDDAVLASLDPVGGAMVSRLRSLLVPDMQTASGARAGTGLWSVLALDLLTVLGYAATITSDYTPYLFAGLGYRNDSTTLAVRNGVSVPPVEPETTMATIPASPQPTVTSTPVSVSGPPFDASASIPLPAGGWTRTGPLGCEGTSTYGYLRPGSVVSIVNETGRTLVETSNAEVGGLLDFQDNCTIRVQIQDVPAGIGGYTMYIAGVRVAVALRTQGLTQVEFFSVLR